MGKFEITTKINRNQIDFIYSRIILIVEKLKIYSRIRLWENLKSQQKSTENRFHIFQDNIDYREMKNLLYMERSKMVII